MVSPSLPPTPTPMEAHLLFLPAEQCIWLFIKPINK